MTKIEFKEKFDEITRILPETKLNVVLDFAYYLISKKESKENFDMQLTSSAYQEWLSNENDVYDELFKDKIE